MSIENKSDILEATILRSVKLVAESWEEENLSLSDMTSQLEALCNMVDGETDFASFAKESNLTSQERLM